jgi:hypothetical protein
MSKSKLGSAACPECGVCNAVSGVLSEVVELLGIAVSDDEVRASEESSNEGVDYPG